MAQFVLSTLRTSAPEPEAAITIDGSHYLISRLEGGLFTGRTDVKYLLEDWSQSCASLQILADKIQHDPSAFFSAKITDAVLDTPIRFPNKLLAVGANYASHLREMGLPAEKWDPMPFFTCPPTTSVVGPGRTVKYPLGTSQLDWECELVVVVGSKLRNATLKEAKAAIAGYTIGLDLSCRDLMAPGAGGLVDLMRGKAQESMKPCGPSFVPKTVLTDGTGHLGVQLRVNGELMIDGNTSDMIWSPEECLEEISKVLTLEPGDMILTGTPAGSAKSHGGRWLKVGDCISASIEGLGELDVEVVN